MANLNAAALASNLERAEVDTALPFESVRAAISIFGSQIGAKKASFLEKGTVQDAEQLHAQEELLRLKELLKSSEREKEKALHELGQAKEALKHADKDVKKPPHSRVVAKEGFASDPHNVQKNGQMLMDSEDKYAVWEFKLKFACEKHTAAFAEMESAKQQLADLKQELLASSSEKDHTFKQTENAFIAMEGSVKGAECLSAELAGVNNWLSILRHASFDVCSKEKIGAKNLKGSLNDMDTGSQGLDMGHELEFKLLSMMNESLRIREELKCGKDEEAKAISAASDVLVILKAMGLELEEKTSQKQEGLKVRSYNRASLLAILEALKMQAETLQKEMQALREKEAKTEAKLGALNAELSDARAALEAARAEAEKNSTQLSLALKHAEADAKEGKTKIAALREEISITRSRTAAVEAKAIISVSQLSQALKQSEADLAEAKNEITTLLEEASKASIQNPTAEASSMESISQISQALKQAEVDLVQAKKEIKVLQDEVGKAQAGNAASIESFTQSYQALKQAEAELERMKVDMQTLQGKLSQAQTANAAEEAKAKESIAQLSEALKQAEAELEIVKAEKNASQGEFSWVQSCNAVEVAKAEESLEQLSQALEQADKETTLARAEMKALREELLIGESRDGNSLMPMHEVAFSQEMTREATVTMGLKDVRLVSAHVTKALQAEIGHVNEGLSMKTTKMEALEDVESIKSVLKQALHRAEMAEIGKLSAESELKRLRDREYRRKEKATAFITQQNRTKNPANGNEETSAFPSKPHCELLGNVLNINISAEKTKTLVQIGPRKLRKVNTLNSTGISSKKT